MSGKEFCVLDIAHGSCSLLVTEDHCVVFDVGHAQTILAFLSVIGRNKIDKIYISHADQDHINGLIPFLASDNITIDTICVNPDAVKSSRLWALVVTALEDGTSAGRFKTQVGLVAGSTTNDNLGEIVIEILFPTISSALRGVGAKKITGGVISSNDNSAVFRIVENGVGKVFIAGDMSAASWELLKASTADISAELLILPHHGGSFGTAAQYDDLLQTVKPTITVASNGRNQFSNPTLQTVNAVKRNGGRIVCTQISKACGTQTAMTRRFPARGYADDISCAGSIVFEFSAASINMTNEDEHNKVIDLLASPLCK